MGVPTCLAAIWLIRREVAAADAAGSIAGGAAGAAVPDAVPLSGVALWAMAAIGSAGVSPSPGQCSTSRAPSAVRSTCGPIATTA
jgi:hypothetical protein